MPGGIADLNGVSCSSSSDCVAAGTSDSSEVSPAVLATTNGGSSWENDSIPSGLGSLYSIACTPTASCVAAGEMLTYANGSYTDNGPLIFGNSAPAVVETSVPYALTIKNYAGNQGILAFSAAQIAALESDVVSTLPPEPGFAPEVGVLPDSYTPYDVLLAALGGSDFINSTTLLEETNVQDLTDYQSQGDQIEYAVPPGSELAIVIPFAQPPPAGSALVNISNVSYEYAPCNSTFDCSFGLPPGYGIVGQYVYFVTTGEFSDPFTTGQLSLSTAVDFNANAVNAVDSCNSSFPCPAGIAEITNVLGASLNDLSLSEGTNPTSRTVTPNGQLNVQATGTGSLITGVYSSAASVEELASCGGLLNTSCTYFDTAIPVGASISALAIRACFAGDTSMSWYDPTGGLLNVGAWQAIDPSQVNNYVVSSSTSPPCVSFTVTASTIPSISDLSGTTFVATPHQGPQQQLENLYAAVQGIGPGSSLADKVSQAEIYLSADEVNDVRGVLQGLINEITAQTGKKISTSVAARLLTDTRDVLASLS